MRLDVVQQFMSRLIAVRSRLPALLVAIISVACGQATADHQAITLVSVTITVPPAMSQALPPLSGSGKSYAPIPSVLALVDSVSLSVINSANQPVMGATTVPISAGQTVPVTIEVLTGPARTFVGQAMDTQGTVLFQGRSSPVDLDGNPISVGIAMTLNPFPLDLRVTTSGSGSGTVTSSPPGIECDTACSAPFILGTDVTLTAAPDATSTFTGWAGTACPGTGTCTVSMTAAQAVTATFTRIQYALGVTQTGTGGGTVTSSPAGIDCGSSCSAPFDAGSTVTLTAAPDATSLFTGWAGAACSGSGTCVVPMTATQAVTATFIRIPYALTVTKTGTGGGTVSSAPAGIACGTTCAAVFDAATTVTLTAAPDATSTFAGWAGAGCTGTGTCIVPMTATQTVTATFIRIQYRLDVTKTGTGGGTVTSSPAGIDCGATCAASFDAASGVTLTAAPDATSTFTGWTGCTSSTATTCTVTMTAAQAVTATFIRIPYALTVTKTGTGGGTVTSSPAGIACGTTCAAVFDAATTVTLTAAPDATSMFAGWAGAGCTGTGTCIVPMTATQAVTATFTHIPYALTVSKTGTGSGTVTSAPAGIACGTTCAAVFDAATTVTLTAAPDATSMFGGWTGCSSSTGITCTVTIDAAKAVTATFTLIQYTLTVTKTGTGGGTVTSSPGGIDCGATCSAPLDAGSSVTLTAAPDATSTFTGWAGAGCAGTGTCIVPMTAAQAATAIFTRIQYRLDVTKTGTGGGTVTSSPAGIDCGATCAASFDAASGVTLTAAPDATSTFTGWTGCTSSTATTCTVTMTTTHAVTATFTRIQYALTVTKIGTGGGTVTSTSGTINCGSTCSAPFDAGSTVTLTATPDATSTFTGWDGAACSGTGTCIVPMTAAEAVTATFTRIQYRLDVTKIGTGGGTVMSPPAGIDCGAICAASFDAATTVTLTVAPDATSTFTGWTGCTSSTGTTCSVTMDAAKAVTATFTRIQYTLTVTPSGTGGGTVLSVPPRIDCGTTCLASFDTGSSVTLTATPDATSTFTGWAGACTGTGTCVIVFGQDETVTATFTPLPPVIDPNGLSLEFGVIGDTFKIKGSGFGNTQGTSVVTVGTVPATTVQRWSDREIVALIPAGLSVSSAGIPYDIVVTVNGQQSDRAFITLFDRVLGVGGKNGETNFDQFVLQTNQVTDVIDVLPGTVDGGSSSGVSISADGTTAAEADAATSVALAASERLVSFNTQPSVALLTINAQQVNVYGQDIAVSGDSRVALIAAFIPDSQNAPAPALVRVTGLDTLSPVSAELPMPPSECVHEVALSSDGNTAAVITGALDGCSSFSSPVRIYRIDNVLSSPTYTEVAVLTSLTAPPDHFTDLALSADGSTLIAGRIVLNADQTQWNAGILRVTGFKTAPIPHDDSYTLTQYPTACPPASVDVDLSAEGTTAIVGIVKPSDRQTCPAELDRLFQVRDADLGLAQAPHSFVLPTAIGSAVTNLEGVALNSGGSIALVRTNLTEAVLMRVDAFNTATPVPTNLPPTGSLADMNRTLPPRPQDYVDLQ